MLQSPQVFYRHCRLEMPVFEIRRGLNGTLTNGSTGEDLSGGVKIRNRRHQGMECEGG